MPNRDSGQFNLFVVEAPRNITVRCLAWAFICLVFTTLFLDWVFVRYRLLDESVAPAYWSGQKVVTFRWAYQFSHPQQNDLIIFSPVEGIYVAGKIIALPGEQAKTSFDTKGYNPAQVVPNAYVSVQLNTARQPTSRDSGATHLLVPLAAIKGKIIGPWQVQLI
ncbi:MAG TPA: S26 family signal peptidase [Desulfobacteria bacterium]|nr:S26 family signal peptidase [Desulfobacteria bacterium]